jgi:hypothetical protein
MQYLLVQNNAIVHLGPITWKQRFIQSEITDLIEQEELKTPFQVPATEQGYIALTDGFEIFPVTLDTPSFDSTYQHLAGPTWTYTNNMATGTYIVQDLDVVHIKSKLKEQAASVRFSKENVGTSTTLASGVVSLATDRANRQQYATMLSTIGTSTIQFKTNGQFLMLNEADLTQMTKAVNDYVQALFDAEKVICDQIDAATDIATLKAIIIQEPIQNAIKL